MNIILPVRIRIELRDHERQGACPLGRAPNARLEARGAPARVSIETLGFGLKLYAGVIQEMQK
ncbi:MAG: hypothetical protein H0T58_02015 [Gemmatimonadales bacterium]|nr:hypothetical protein [Gemmatimonadales bacterium]